MSDAKRTQRAAKVAAIPGVRSVTRPQDEVTPAFDLAYVRPGPPSSSPVLVIPGGPGLASVLPYRGLRRRADRQGLDVLMEPS